MILFLRRRYTDLHRAIWAVRHVRVAVCEVREAFSAARAERHAG